jgi:hypothetical protein
LVCGAFGEGAVAVQLGREGLDEGAIVHGYAVCWQQQGSPRRSRARKRDAESGKQ